MSLAQVSTLSLKSHTQPPALYLILRLLDIDNWTTGVISFSALHFPTPPVLREETGSSTYKVTQVRNGYSFLLLHLPGSPSSHNH